MARESAMINRLWLAAFATAGLFFGIITGRKLVIAFFAGWFVPFSIKYVFFGLESWDAVFHPERTQADATGPYRQFFKPFLGVFS